MLIGAEKEQGATVMEQVGPYIIGHVSNSDQDHPIFHSPNSARILHSLEFTDEAE